MLWARACGEITHGAGTVYDTHLNKETINSQEESIMSDYEMYCEYEGKANLVAQMEAYESGYGYIDPNYELMDQE